MLLYQAEELLIEVTVPFRPFLRIWGLISFDCTLSHAQMLEQLSIVNYGLNMSATDFIIDKLGGVTEHISLFFK